MYRNSHECNIDATCSQVLIVHDSRMHSRYKGMSLENNVVDIGAKGTIIHLPVSFSILRK